MSIYCNRSGVPLTACFIKPILKGAITEWTVYCWPPQHNTPLSFTWLHCLVLFSFWVAHTSQIWCSSGLMGAAQIAHYFWQQYFGSLELVRYILWWTGNQPPCGMLLAEMFCCCDMMIPFFLILAKSALKATLDQTLFSQKPSSWLKGHCSTPSGPSDQREWHQACPATLWAAPLLALAWFSCACCVSYW